MNPYQIALTQFGVTGIAGVGNDPTILKYFRDIGAGWTQDDDVSWCACFVNWCLFKAGRKYSSALNARQFLTYGTATTTPKLGDIVVLWRISPTSAYGHVGFYISTNKDGSINMLGGNEDNSVKIKAYPSYQLLSYRTI